MLSRELDEAITILRSNEFLPIASNSGFFSRLADLLLVCAAEGDVLQAVAEGVAKTIVQADKVKETKVELRDV